VIPLLAGATIVITMMCLALLQYAMPPGFDNPPGVNAGGVYQFRSVVWKVGFPSLGTASFVWIFRLLLGIAWGAYTVLLVAGFRQKYIAPPWAPALVVSTCGALAFICPPSLSADVYAYAGWGRMAVLHGWNPYTQTLAALATLGDPAAGLIPVGAGSVHGPIWNVLCIALVGLFRDAGVWWQVVALKLLAGAGVCAAALAGREISRAYDRDRADLTLLAIGLNPLLLIEGPGNGHNDVLMIALMMAGIAAHTRGRRLTGYLLIGLSAGVKFITLIMLPWLLIETLAGVCRRRATVEAVGAVALALAPTVLGYALFWEGPRTLASIGVVYEEKAYPGDRASAGSGSPRDDTAVDSAERRPTVSIPVRLCILGSVFAAFTFRIWRAPAMGQYISAWSAFALALAWVGMPMTFAWYMAWPFGPALTQWRAGRRGISMACIVLSALILAWYTVPHGDVPRLTPAP
jgi:hypothetical protein